MTEDDFRRLALDLPEAVESAHMEHPDFRVRGKIFATLSRGPGEAGEAGEVRGMVKFTPHQQGEFVRANPAVYSPANGAWGVRGATYVRLAATTARAVRPALVAAWRNTAPKRLSAVFVE